MYLIDNIADSWNIMSQAKSNKTKDRILQISLQLFNERGERLVTTNHIAAELGISPGNLYYHFRNKQEIIKQLAQQYQVIILYKRAYTLIACPDGNVYFNSTGNAGMATAGSGDVLTGIISGLLAQGFAPKEAALAGVYMHGLSGDLALENNNNSNLIATDIIHQIPLAKAIIMGTE